MYTLEVVSRPNLRWHASDLDHVAKVVLVRTMPSDLHVIYCYQAPDEGVLDACIAELERACGLGNVVSFYYGERQSPVKGRKRA